MLAVTLRLARGTAGRLAAAGVAIALGAAFVAAVLLATGLLQRTTYDQVASRYAGADVVLDVGDQPLDQAPDQAPDRALDQGAVDALGRLPGARGAVGTSDGSVQLVAGGRTAYASLATTTSTEPFASLPSAVPTEGALPGAPGQVALTTDVADALEVEVGQRVVARTYPGASAPVPADGSGDAGPTDTPVTVVALLPPASTLSSGTALVTPGQARAWASPDAPDASLRSTQVLVAAAPGTSPEALVATVEAAVPGAAAVRTGDQASQDAVDDLTSDQDVITGVLLAFAVLALFVAGVVITNTFAVLVAQRTRQLALLRCVGATAGQVRSGVVAEAALLGLVASVVGAAAGTALAAGAAAVLARTTDGTVPATVETTPASVLAPIVLGTVATVLAALAPARAATRVAPLAALRPPAPVDARARGSRLRLVGALLLVLAGGAALAGGIWVGGDGGRAGLGLALALAGGAVSFLGVLVGAVFVVPALVSGIGRLVAISGGAAARLSVANAVRNPRRTTTTTSALLIGVTLVSLVVVGAASTQRTLASTLDSRYPVDAEVGPAPELPYRAGLEDVPGRPAALRPEVSAAVSDVDGVAAVAPLRGATVTGEGLESSFAVPVRGVDPEQARTVLQVPDGAERLARGTALVPDGIAGLLGVGEGRALVLADGDRRLTVDVAVTTLSAGTVLLTPDDLDELAPRAPVSTLWVRLAAGADPAGSLDAIRTAVASGAGQGVDGAADDTVPVSGAAVQRASYDQVITVLLSVVVGLLAVAVLIAFIGVANTLSLSVLERTRESALLRALGLTRGQLRSMLALEGALVAGVGALVGVALGIGYGWAGTQALLVGVGPVRLDVPWGSLATVVVVSVVAGLAASVLPGRRAARTSPVAALGE